ncbi:putative exosortase EpsH [Rubrivivax sp. A210]|uniref:exosortase B n=1 Tax=Rubrivivax sp. A210 TaxID=2772301 RepID=UPI0019190E92|nr:exosortase B [Rubrivivax sp. A210]CAD5369194.1 putative exosortase EpsH [Rubrivivax sp. A210]
MNSDSRARIRWALFGVLALMYAPLLYSLLNNGLWSSSEHGHGPIVLTVCLWLIHKRWGEARATLVADAAPALAWPVLLAAALLYVVGSTLDVVYAEVGSVIPMIIGLLLLTDGKQAVKALAFPLCFMVFMVPLPGFIVDPVGQAMKLLVSTVTETLLHAAGYPISRTGVILQIGQYQLLVADACAGMRTLFMLEALGILYLNLVRHNSWFRNVTLALLIVPISFAANIIRVIVLSLITYHLGDEAGQGFLHGFAGMVLFMSALGLTIFVDTLLRTAGHHWGKPA